MNIVTIDGGTTNTRVTLVKDGKITGRIKIKAGAGNTSSDILTESISQKIAALCSENGIAADKLDAIYASGMLTSELGIYKLDHVQAPAGKQELKNGSQTVKIPGIPFCPVTFLPGVKNNADYADLAQLCDADVMRGEETEIVGIAETLELHEAFTAVLPGSHTKIVRLDKDLRILGCHTTLAGELLGCIPQNTILKNSVELPLISADGNKEFLLKGLELCRKIGFNAAVFKARVMANFFGYSKCDSAMLLAGIILEPDIKAISDSAGSDIIAIGGSQPLKGAFAYLLEKTLPNKIVVIDDATAENATVYGCLAIFSE